MLYAKPLLPILIVLLLVHYSTLKKVDLKTDRWRGLARLGFGLAKLGILVLPLEWMIHLLQQAEPAALTGKAFWMAALAQTSQLYLAFSGVADMLLGFRNMRGESNSECCDAPYRQGSFLALWKHLQLGLWKPVGPPLGRVMPTLVLVGGLAVLWHGSLASVSVWFILQLVILYLEVWRGKSLFAPLPLPFRVIFTMLLFVVTNVLLVTPNLETAMAGWKMMFTMGSSPIYAAMLEKRMTSGWLQSMQFIALLTSVGLPRLPLLLQMEIKTWRIIGFALLPLSALLAVRDSLSMPALIKQMAQWPVTWIFDEGNAQVHLGYQGWFFPMHELDRLTLRRALPGKTKALIEQAATLKSLGIPMMVIAMPNKVALYPQHFFRADYQVPLQPPGQKAKLDQLTAAGITVVDPAQALWDRLLKEQAFYQNDSHWTDDTMKEVANITAKQIRKLWPALHEAETPLINATILDRVEQGDLVKKLFPLGQQQFGEEKAQLVSISGLDPDPSSPILIYADDLIEVFDAPSASFGNADGQTQRAGFVTQLASLLGRPLALPSAQHPLTTKKLIIHLLWADEL
jgi:SGNH hydrolase-like domain, acetyltransferase AlgX